MVKLMETATKGDSKFLKRVNEARILNIIRTDSEISRVEISKRANMSKAGVSEIISRLIENEYILEKGKGTSTTRGGKRPTILEINPDGGFVIGLHVENTRCHVLIADIRSDVIDRKTLEYPISEAIDSALPEICRFMDGIIKKNRLQKQRLLSIAIAVPGLVDRERGDLIIAHTEGWAHQPFIEVFQEYFQVPVILENDVNALTLAEFTYGVGKPHDDLLCLHFADGLGAGIIENNELVSGIYGGAGEVGYMTYVPCDRKEQNIFLPEFSPIRYGILFAVPNLLRSLQQACRMHDYSLPEDLNIKNFFSFMGTADHRHPAFRTYFDQFSDILADLSANMIIMLNPSIFALSGLIFNVSDDLNNSVIRKVRSILDKTPLKNMTDIQISALQEDEVLIGIVEIALSVLYKPGLGKTLA